MTFHNRDQSPLGETEHPGGPCLPGIQRLFVDVNGQLYPCEKVNEESELMNIGTLDKGFFLDKSLNILNIGKLTKEECKSCWAFRFCKICAVAADDTTELSRKKKLEHCERIKVDIYNMMRNYTMLKELGYNFDD